MKLTIEIDCDGDALQTNLREEVLRMVGNELSYIEESSYEQDFSFKSLLMDSNGNSVGRLSCEI